MTNQVEQVKEAYLESFNQLYQLKQQIDSLVDPTRQQIRADAKQRTQQVQRQYEHAIAQAQATLEAHQASTQATITAFNTDYKYLVAPWVLSEWQPFLKGQAVSESLPPLIRLGSAKHSPQIPAMVRLLGSNHLIIESQGRNNHARAKQLLQSIITRILTTFPIGMARFTFIDPTGLGDNFQFTGLPDMLIGDRVHCEIDEIQVAIRELTEITRDRNRKLGREFGTVEQLRQSPTNQDPLPYYFLCIADFPSMFNDDTIGRLITLVEQGIRHGVYLLVQVNQDMDIPPAWSSVVEQASVVRLQADTTTCNYANRQLEFVPDALPGYQLFDELIAHLEQSAKRVGPASVLRGYAMEEDSMTEQPHVFISYSRTNDDPMQIVKQRLHDNGLKTWTDEYIEPGSPIWEHEIEQAIREAGALVVLLSPAAAASKWVEAELRHAQLFGVAIFPMLLDGDLTNAIPMILTTTQFVDLRDLDAFETNLSRLIKQVKTHIEMPPLVMLYAQEDLAFAIKLKDDLKQERLKVWMVEDVPVGNNRDRVMQRMLTHCGGVVVLLSPEARVSQQVRNAISYSQQVRKEVFPVWVRGTEQSVAILDVLASNAIDMRDSAGYKLQLMQLIPALNAHLRAF